MAGPVRSVVLDSEAVDALADVRHPKHDAVLPYVEAVAQRRSRRRSIEVFVPVAVRVESGRDRTSPRAATVNRVSGAADVPLTGEGANRAAAIRQRFGVSVVDATVIATAQRAVQPVVIITSDAGDMRMLADHLGGDVRVVTI